MKEKQSKTCWDEWSIRNGAFSWVKGWRHRAENIHILWKYHSVQMTSSLNRLDFTKQVNLLIVKRAKKLNQGKTGGQSCTVLLPYIKVSEYSLHTECIQWAVCKVPKMHWGIPIWNFYIFYFSACPLGFINTRCCWNPSCEIKWNNCFRF